jgi:hypothetical protein
MNPLNYPLEQLMTIKKNRFDAAVKILEEKKAALIKEEEQLLKVEKERNEVLDHKKAKLQQLRDELDQGTTTDKIQQMKSYLKVVDDRLSEKERKVREQKSRVETAKKQVAVATSEMYAKKKDVEKLEMHRAEWEKELKHWMEQKEGLEQDELGNAAHDRKKREQKDL